MSGLFLSQTLKIAVTGTAWMGGGIGSVQSAIEELLSAADQEILIAIYEITEGASEFVEKIRVSLARGIRVTFIINRYYEKPLLIRKKLENLKAIYPYFELLNFTPENPENINDDLHAKLIVVDRSRALVGSANLTWNGLIGNHELAVVIYGKDASKIAELFDRLSQDRHISRVNSF
jgi:phosphatidylserine/phosphatidylglycerophosphate/cardiolipin synthase-like enzyme